MKIVEGLELDPSTFRQQVRALRHVPLTESLVDRAMLMNSVKEVANLYKAMTRATSKGLVNPNPEKLLKDLKIRGSRINDKAKVAEAAIEVLQREATGANPHSLDSLQRYMNSLKANMEDMAKLNKDPIDFSKKSYLQFAYPRDSAESAALHYSTVGLNLWQSLRAAVNTALTIDSHL